eukprot:TRINITY_DN16507_c0_g1_i1.p2 TRINITY_DN16507_c0_g1~~TRINITY_DN16507_c0_g1_i1.p2  ORF type:complete len:107 (+),score=19.74 TRINITY_DN16507_c0_g1_i1:77-397(+)
MSDSEVLRSPSNFEKAGSKPSFDPLPADLLRAVPLHRALQCYGRHFSSSSSSSSTRGSDDDCFRLSSAVSTHIDDFISHEWSTSRVVKYPRNLRCKYSVFAGILVA